jgi:hypothetical protein
MFDVKTLSLKTGWAHGPQHREYFSCSVAHRPSLFSRISSRVHVARSGLASLMRLHRSGPCRHAHANVPGGALELLRTCSTSRSWRSHHDWRLARGDPSGRLYHACVILWLIGWLLQGRGLQQSEVGR